MKIPKVLFFGTPELACPSLIALSMDPSVEVVGVIVFPDKKVGRKQVLTPCAVKQTALKLKLPIYEVANKKTLTNVIEQTDFDLGIVIAFGLIFPREILEIPDKPIFNVHFSLLPQYRGASPVQSAILNGDEISGITIQKMKFELDAGDIYLQETMPIKNKSTAQLWQEMGVRTGQIITPFCQQYNQISPLEQDGSMATFCHKFVKQDGVVDPNTTSAKSIYQKFLAFDPWPEISIQTTVGNVKIKGLSWSEASQNVPGEIACKKGFIQIKTAQIPGKKTLDIADILRGQPDLFKIN